MTNRENTLAILNYEKHSAVPVVHFGYWPETLVKWAEEGHIPMELAHTYADGNETDRKLEKMLGFDFNWQPTFGIFQPMHPLFEPKVLEEYEDGGKKITDNYGVTLYVKNHVVSIPQEIDHLLKDRQSYEEHFKPKLKFNTNKFWDSAKSKARFDARVAALKETSGRQNPLGLHCGSLFGEIRNWVGIEELSYLYADDEDLYKEIIEDVGNVTYEYVKILLDTGIQFDYGHFWEDICFNHGPLVVPEVFVQLVGPHYKRITNLLCTHGVNIVSLDCDGKIDALLPTWLENGINTMFPIEVGTWEASIAPWREQYGINIRGVGGMNKNVFALDYTAVDKEIERLKRLVSLGGYIPCPDHRIPPDAKWENVQYYCEQIRKI